MAGVYKLEIAESEAELRTLLRKQKTALGKERVQLLYLLKSKQAKTIQAAAQMLGRHRVTIQEWLRHYREGGLEAMLNKKPKSGRPRKIPQWAEKALNKRLQEPESFKNYGEITKWLEEELGISANYKTVHQLVHYRLKASLKVARPESVNQISEKVEDFKK